MSYYALSDAELKRRAKEYIKLKPTFRILSMSSPESRAWRDKIFQVRCLECGTVEARDLSWLKSTYGCMCTRGSKISKTRAMSGSEYAAKYLKGRKLELASNFAGMHRKVDARCLRCGFVWTTEPCNLRKAGCPKCAPELMRQSNLKKYGVEHTFQRPEVRRKRARTMRARYGTIHALQNKAIFDNNLETAYRLKRYRLGRRTVYIQGYEPQALDYIIQTIGISPERIVCGTDSDMPEVPYMFLGVSSIYHPDIYIPSRNLIIEVKGRYTFKAGFERNEAKRKACLKAGYRFKYLVMNKDGSVCHDYKAVISGRKTNNALKG